MKIYFDGRYWDENINEKDKQELINKAPQIYFKLFTKPIKIIEKLPDLQIYQVCYDRYTETFLDGGFIKYFTGFNHNYENDVILDIWRKREFINAKYVGVLSWRFYQKTGLISTDLKPTKKVLICQPKGYEKYKHPYSREGFQSIQDMAALVDKYKVFDFKLKGFKVKKQVWCNYWIATPDIFDDYCTRYLSKVIEFLKDKEIYNATEFHRGKYTPSVTFFLEGLFSVYLTREKIDYEST